jgi:hypothetical protein
MSGGRYTAGAAANLRHGVSEQRAMKQVPPPGATVARGTVEGRGIANGRGAFGCSDLRCAISVASIRFKRGVAFTASAVATPRAAPLRAP